MKAAIVPTEVLVEILVHLQNRDLRVSGQVCRKWRTVAIPRLYATLQLRIDSRVNYKKYLRSLDALESLLRESRTISESVIEVCCDPSALGSPYEKTFMTAILSVMDALPYLSKVHFPNFYVSAAFDRYFCELSRRRIGTSVTTIHLTEFDFNVTGQTLASGIWLDDLPHLHTLILDKCFFNQHWYSEWARATKISSLIIHQGEIPELAITHGSYRQPTTLRNLDIEPKSLYTLCRHFISLLATDCPNLRSFRIAAGPSCSTDGMDFLRPRIRELFSVARISKIRELEISGIPHALRDDELRRIFKYGVALRKVIIMDCVALTGTTVDEVSCDGLEVLSVRGCEALEGIFLEKIVKVCSMLWKLEVPERIADFVKRLELGLKKQRGQAIEIISFDN